MISYICLCLIISRSISVANGIISFFLTAEYYSIVCMYHIFFVHYSVDGHLGHLHVLTIVNSAAMNIRAHVSFQTMFFSGFMPRSGIAGSCGSSIFSFLRNLPYCFPSWLHQFTFLPVEQEGSLLSTASPAFIIYRLLMMAILTSVRWHLIVVLQIKYFVVV